MFHVHLQSAFQETFFLFQREELLPKRTFCFSSSASTKARVSLSAWMRCCCYVYYDDGYDDDYGEDDDDVEDDYVS